METARTIYSEAQFVKNFFTSADVPPIRREDSLTAGAVFSKMISRVCPYFNRFRPTRTFDLRIHVLADPLDPGGRGL